MLEDLVGPSIEMLRNSINEVPDAIGEVYISAGIAVFFEAEKRETAVKNNSSERATKK